MKAIVAVDLNWGIGFKGNLLQTIPDDMKFFKQHTLNQVVVMGRETFESLPGKSPLKNRINIVLSKNKLFNDKRLIICNSIGEVFNVLKKYNEKDIFIIGGEMIYRQFAPYCKEIYVTKIKKQYVADRYFPNLDKDDNWVLVDSSEDMEYMGINYNFNRYLNKDL